MTVEQLQSRDARIAAIEVKPRAARTPAEQDELGMLLRARDVHWQRLPAAIARARRKAASLATYARQIGLPFEGEIA